MHKGLFLDLDGTIANSISIMKTVYFNFLSEFNRIGSVEEFDKLTGPSLNDIITELSKSHQILEEHSVLLNKYISILNEEYKMVLPNEGVYRLLTIAMERSWKCAIVSSASEQTIKMWVKKNNLNSLINLIVGFESVKKGKPDPECYLKALELLKCNAKESIAIEDSRIGLLSALGAGLSTYAYRFSASNEQLPKNIVKNLVKFQELFSVL